MRGHAAAHVDGATAGPGTNLFTVVDGVGLQVIADIAHDEKCGNCAQFLAPSVLLIQVPGRRMVGEAGAGARKARGECERKTNNSRANFVHPSAHPTFNNAC